MIAAADMDVADRIRAEGPVVLIAGQDVATEYGIEERPATAAWEVYGPRMRAIHATAPGVLHQAARRLQDGGWLRGVISLADDVLFEEAGVRDVIALRGSVERSICTTCGYSEPLGCLLELLPAPRCAACGGELRPDVVLPTEPLPHERVARARSLVRSASVLLVAGSPPSAALAELDLAEDARAIELGASAPGSRLAAIARELEGRTERGWRETTS